MQVLPFLREIDTWEESELCVLIFTFFNFYYVELTNSEVILIQNNAIASEHLVLSQANSPFVFIWSSGRSVIQGSLMLLKGKINFSPHCSAPEKGTYWEVSEAWKCLPEKVLLKMRTAMYGRNGPWDLPALVRGKRQVRGSLGSGHFWENFCTEGWKQADWGKLK